MDSFMDTFISLIGLFFMGAIMVAIILAGIIMARKAGILPEKKPADPMHEGGSVASGLFINWPKPTGSLMFRFVLIALLTLLMMLPLDMVSTVVSERSHLYQSVIANIANTWGHSQKLSGPVLLIPYTEKHIQNETVTDKNGNKQKIKKVYRKHLTAIVLPEALNIEAQLNEEKRKRSLYQALVYKANLTINGHFARPDVQGLSQHIETIHWDKAWLTLGISDTQAIKHASPLEWNDTLSDF